MNSTTNYTTLRSAVEEIEQLAIEADNDIVKSKGLLFAKQLNAVDKTVRVVKKKFSKLLDDFKHLDIKSLNEPCFDVIALIIARAEELSVKLEKLNQLFEKEVKDNHLRVVDEFLALRDFYENLLKARQTKILVVKQENKINSEETVFHLEKTEEQKFYDLVNKDKSYDLFYLKSEEGKPFYDTSFVRHLQIKPRNYLDTFLEDPFIEVKSLIDSEVAHLAQNIYQITKKHLEVFLKELPTYKIQGNILLAKHAAMALMLAKNFHNHLKYLPKKSCQQYFLDFQGYLRKALESFTYKSLSNCDVKEFKSLEKAWVDLLQNLAAAFYLNDTMPQGFCRHIEKMTLSISGSQKDGENAYDYLRFVNHALDEYLKKFLSGPVLKAIDHLLFQHHPGFDPWLDGNLPYRFLKLDNVSFLHVPSPTKQEFIHKAYVIEEFKAFLNYLKGKQKKLLMINFQDRTIWNEHARCLVIEQLQNEAEFNDTFKCITLASETLFYKQEEPYNVNTVSDFIVTLKENLLSESCGFYFPKELKKHLEDNLLDKFISEIHEKYFYEKNVLTKKERCLFIDILYFKLIESFYKFTNVDFVAFSSKDAVDIVPCFEIAFYVRSLSNKKPDEKIKDDLIHIAFSPAFYIRERLISQDEFNRALALLSNI
jgi:hypothetical protein